MLGTGWFCGFKRQSSFKESTNYASIFSQLISNSFKAKHPGKLFQQYPFSNVPYDKMVFLQLQRDSEIPESVSIPSKEYLILWDKSAYYYYLSNNCSMPGSVLNALNILSHSILPPNHIRWANILLILDIGTEAERQSDVFLVTELSSLNSALLGPTQMLSLLESTTDLSVLGLDHVA